MLKRSLIALVTGLIMIVPVSPSFAGSGTDGVFEVSWKDWKKSKAKNCAKQKINITLLQPISYATAELKLYNGDDEEVASSFVIINGTSKRSGFFQFCYSPGTGPYYINVQGRLGLPGTNTEFEIPYKFKKK